MDAEEACTVVKLVVSLPRQAAKEAKETPKPAYLKDRLIEAYPWLLSGVANSNPPDRGQDKAQSLSRPGISTTRRTSGSDEAALDGIY